MQHALSAVATALSAVDRELERHRDGLGKVSSPEQLQVIRHQLATMHKQLASGAIPDYGSRVRGLGRTISDSWPLNSELGALVLAAEQEYLQV